MKTNTLALMAGVQLAILALTPEVYAGGGLGCVARGITLADSNHYAIKQLREAGPAGLEAVFNTYRDQIEARVNGRAQPDTDAEWKRIRSALDTIGAQRDCYASKLYWHTDFEQAKAAAKQSGKPILSLRLLGRLDEEYSCANSRFFRTTLYANETVSQYLRDHFVLHWQSVRPVPRITIDMGDGRKIERTITGNSIHYILDAEGNPIDALPGLYGAKPFLAGLQRAADAQTQSAKLNHAEREAFLKNYHSTRLTEIQRQWAEDLARVAPSTRPAPQSFPATVSVAIPNAISASRIAESKSGVEMPMLRSLFGEPAPSRNDLEAQTDDATWKAIAALHHPEARLDDRSRHLIQAKQPTVEAAMPIAFTKSFVETPMMRMLRTLEHSIAEDTVRNEYLLHSRIHQWFAEGAAPAKVDALNAKVYSELFLTPDSDPWLGLAPSHAFSALDHGGLIQN